MAEKSGHGDDATTEGASILKFALLILNPVVWVFMINWTWGFFLACILCFMVPYYGIRYALSKGKRGKRRGK